MSARGRFPPGLRVPARKPRRPSVLRFRRCLSQRGAIKPPGGQRRARDPRLGNLAGDPGGVDSAAAAATGGQDTGTGGIAATGGKF